MIPIIDFSRCVRGKVYGTNTRTIYEAFCDELGWDKRKANEFGRQGTPLYATNCDTDRTSDVWFICHYETQESNKRINNNHICNLILNNGNNILEKVASHCGESNNAPRITFIKTKRGYEFLGVYELTENGTTRYYKRISDVYPLK